MREAASGPSRDALKPAKSAILKTPSRRTPMPGFLGSEPSNASLFQQIGWFLRARVDNAGREVDYLTRRAWTSSSTERSAWWFRCAVSCALVIGECLIFSWFSFPVNSLSTLGVPPKATGTQPWAGVTSETTSKGATVPPKEYKVVQGYREGSNVEAVSELVVMIQALRAYEASTRTQRTISEAVGLLTRPGGF